jgi:hypothetical protein
MLGIRQDKLKSLAEEDPSCQNLAAARPCAAEASMLALTTLRTANTQSLDMPPVAAFPQLLKSLCKRRFGRL